VEQTVPLEVGSHWLRCLTSTDDLRAIARSRCASCDRATAAR